MGQSVVRTPNIAIQVVVLIGFVALSIMTLTEFPFEDPRVSKRVKYGKKCDILRENPKVYASYCVPLIGEGPICEMMIL